MRNVPETSNDPNGEFESYGVGGWGVDKRIVPLMVDAHLLDVQSSYFKMSMKNILAWAMEHHANQNPLSSIWKNLASMYCSLRN